jgi:hypothetical protein
MKLSTFLLLAAVSGAWGQGVGIDIGKPAVPKPLYCETEPKTFEPCFGKPVDGEMRYEPYIWYSGEWHPLSLLEKMPHIDEVMCTSRGCIFHGKPEPASEGKSDPPKGYDDPCITPGSPLCHWPVAALPQSAKPEAQKMPDGDIVHFDGEVCLSPKGCPAPKTEPVDVPAIRVHKSANSLLLFTVPAWECEDPTRILEHDGQIPARFWCRKPQP